MLSEVADKPKRKLPRQLAGLVALRAQGFDNKEIADRLRVSVVTLRRLIKKARTEYGWNDIGEQLTDVALPQAVSNVIKHLDHEGTPEAIASGQHAMTREIARGLGALKTHSAVKQETVKKSIQVLRVQIELPPGVQGAMDAVVDGVLATPRRALLPASSPTPAASIVDGEVIRGAV